MPTFNSVTGTTEVDSLIPVEYAKEIIKNVPQESAALKIFRHVQMPSKTTRLPVLNALPQAYFVMGETGLKQTSQVAWNHKDLVAEELAVIVPIPDVVRDDASFDIWAEIMPLISEAFGRALDAAIFFGINKPTTWGADVVSHAAAAGNVLVRGSVSGEDVAGDISAVMGLVEADGFDVNGFVAAKTLKAGLRNLRNAQGSLIFAPSLQADTPSTLFGEQLEYLVNGSYQGNLADLIAMDKTKGIVGIRQDLTFKKFTEGVITDASGAILYNLMQQDMSALRVVMRVAWQVANPPTNLQGTEANRSPFGVLRPLGYV